MQPSGRWAESREQVGRDDRSGVAGLSGPMFSSCIWFLRNINFYIQVEITIIVFCVIFLQLNCEIGELLNR